MDWGVSNLTTLENLHCVLGYFFKNHYSLTTCFTHYKTQIKNLLLKSVFVPFNIRIVDAYLNMWSPLSWFAQLLNTFCMSYFDYHNHKLVSNTCRIKFYQHENIHLIYTLNSQREILILHSRKHQLLSIISGNVLHCFYLKSNTAFKFLPRTVYNKRQINYCIWNKSMKMI